MTPSQTPQKEAQLKELSQLIQTVHQLRAPNGCPWDRAQTHQSLRQYLIEEAYEVLDVLDQIIEPQDLKKEKIQASFREELGDLFLQVLLHSEMTSEVGAFDIYDVAQSLNQKLIRRHPHVFGDSKVESADRALQSWEKEKAKEKATQLDASILDGVPRGLPSLQKAARVLEKVTKVGFQWNDMQGPLEKINEELLEFQTEVLQLDRALPDQKESIRKKVEGELGDLLFTLCNVAYLLKINPEDSLRGTLERFGNRFRHVERKLKERGKTPEQSNLPEMDQYWDEAKKIERLQIWGLTGGIGAGKSTAGKFFEELGIPIIDSDKIAQDLRKEGGLAYAPLIQRFNTADKTELKKIIFNDPQARKDLEKILHPLIQIESEKLIRALAIQHRIILYEATLLVETGRFRDFDGLIVIEAPASIRRDRVLARDPISPTLFQSILDSQASDQDRNKNADLIIKNLGTTDGLKSQIQNFIEKQGWNIP